MLKLLFLYILSILCSCNTISTAQSPSSANLDVESRDAIARVEKDQFIFLKDTLRIKAFFEDNLLGVQSLKLQSIKVLHGITIGDKAEDFYLLVGIDTNKRVKVAKWLTLDNGYLRFGTDSTMEKFVILCDGDIKCKPNVAFLNSKLVLGCGDSLVCFMSSECKSSKSVAIGNVD